jgi:hypothetical protein
VTAVVSIDTAAIRALQAGPVAEDMGRRALRVDSRAKMNAPVDTGRMRAAGYAAPSSDTEGAWDVIFPVDYTIYVHDGTRYVMARPFLADALSAAVE